MLVNKEQLNKLFEESKYIKFSEFLKNEVLYHKINSHCEFCSDFCGNDHCDYYLNRIMYKVKDNK